MQEIALGGRRFKVIDFDRRTVLQDHYLMRKMRQSGVDTVMPMDGDTDTGYMIRVQTALIDSGIAHELLAGYLLPLEKSESDFTQDMARDTAAHIAGCNTDIDRDTVNALSVQLAFGFFRAGLERLKTSLASFSEKTTNPQEPYPTHSVH